MLHHCQKNRRRSARRLLAAGLAFVVLCGSAAIWAQPGVDGPIAIQRIVLPPDRLAKELEKVPKGGMLLFPLAEFDARLERIRKTTTEQDEKPRLTSGHYSAELIDHALQNGKGAWLINYDGMKSAVLGIDALNLALARARWQQGGDAILGDLDGKSLGLLVEPGVAQTCLFDWSLRGMPTADGITFSLAAPACASNTLDLTLPANYWLSVSKGAAPSGPLASNDIGKRLWKVQFSGTKPLEIAVRKVAQTKIPAMTLFARLQTREQITPDRTELEQDFQIDILQGSVNELVLDGDAALQPFDVVPKGAEIEPWSWSVVKKEAKGKGASTLACEIHVKFLQPVQGTIGLKVKSLVGRPTAAPWLSPGLRVRGALSRGETLEVLTHPDLPLGTWDFGTFQLLKATQDALGNQVLSLAQTAVDFPQARRPSVIWPADGVALTTREHLEWRLGPRSAELVASLQFAPLNGQPVELTVKLPPPASGYAIESLDLQPAEQLRDWRVTGDFLIVELKQPLTHLSKTHLEIHLRASFGEIVAGNRTHTLPELLPLNSKTREGAIDVFVDPSMHAQLVSSLLPLATPMEAEGEKRSPGADFRIDYRDQKPGATIRVTPRPTLIHWRGKHAVTLSADNAAMRFRWEAEPTVGSPRTLDFRLGPGFPSAWKITPEQGAPAVRHRERLYLHESLPHLLRLGAQGPIDAAILEAMVPGDSYWRIQLAEPLSQRATYAMEATLPRGPTESDLQQLALHMPRADLREWLGSALSAKVALNSPGRRLWSVPLASPLQAAKVEQEISIDSSSEPIQSASADGALGPRSTTEKTPFHRHFEQTAGPTMLRASTLQLWTQPEKRTMPLAQRCDHATITTYVRKDGGVHQRIQFQLWHWRDTTCPLRLPLGTRISSVKLHDRWLDHLDVRTEPNAVRLTLPFDQNSPFARYEIHTRSEARGSFFPGLLNVKVAPPEWPVAPMDLRRHVCLPDGLAPLTNELTPVGVPMQFAARSPALRRLQQMAASWPFGASSTLNDTLADQRQTVLTAEAQMRRAGFAKTTKLAAVLERFALSHLDGAIPLVIDEPALRSLGLSGATVLTPSDLSSQTGRPFWEKLGLTFVPCANAALLTTTSRMDRLGIHGSAQIADLNDTMAQAIRHGRDASGGFYLITSWLKLPNEDLQSPGAAAFPVAEHLGDFQDMTEWQVPGDATQVESVVIGETSVSRTSGWVLAALLAFMLWLFQRGWTLVTVFRGHVLLLSAAGLAIVWLPGNVAEFYVLPALLTITGSSLVLLVRVIFTRAAISPSGDSTIIRSIGSVLVFFGAYLGLAWNSTAQPASERIHPVYMIDGKAPAVLITPELDARLGQIENADDRKSQPPLLVRATYAGTISNGLATIEADFDVHCLSDQGNLVVPLNGVQLLPGAKLDDNPVFPTLHKNGYQVPIKNRGAHRLHLSFAVRVNSVNEQAALRFGIPKLSQSEMALDWGAPLQTLHCKHCAGAEHATGEGNLVQRWRGQFGPEGDVHFTWTAAGTAAPKFIEVKEAHFWDLRPATPTLWTTMQYAIGAGTLGQCSVALPDGLHVRGVEAVTFPQGVGTAAVNPLLIKSWQILGKSGARRLQVDLAQPASGILVLNLEIVPQLPVRDRQLLPMPAPFQGKSTSGMLGYRMDSADLRPTPRNLAVQSMPTAEFDQTWKKIGLLTMPAASFAWTFQRTPQPGGLELLPQPSVRQVKSNLLWRLDSGHADLQATFQFSSLRDDLMFLEFSIDPAFTLAEASGPDVYRWRLHETLLQVWLRQPKKQSVVTITGWRSAPLQAVFAAKQSVSLPGVSPLHFPHGDSLLEVRPAPGLTAVPTLLRNLRAHPVRPLHYAIEAFPFEAAFSLTQTAAPRPALIVTKIANSADGIEVRHVIRLSPNRGRLPGLRLRLNGAPRESFTLDAPGASVALLPGKQPKSPEWSLVYQPGQPHEVYAILHGHIDRANLADAVLPDVEVEGAAIEGNWIVWPSNLEIRQGDPPAKVVNQKKIRDRISLLSGESWTRDLSTWSAAERSGPVRAIVPKNTGTTNIRIVALTETTWPTDGRWVHDASLWLIVPEPIEMRIRFPAAIEDLVALIDGQNQTAWSLTSQEFVVPIAPIGVPRHLELRYHYSSGDESTRAPNIAGLQIDRAVVAARQRRLMIPPEWMPASQKTQARSMVIESVLYDAERHLHLTAALARDSARPDNNAKLIAAQQQQFHACLRQAEYALAAAKNLSNEKDGAESQKRIDDLRRKNLENANALRFDDQRKIAEKAKKFVSATAPRTDRGSPGLTQVIPPGLASVALESIRDQRVSAQRMQSEWMALAAVFLMMLSLIRKGLALLRWTAPEVISILCIVAILFDGPNLWNLALLLMMLSTRIWRITQGMMKSRQPATVVAVNPARTQPSTQTHVPTSPPP